MDNAQALKFVNEAMTALQKLKDELEKNEASNAASTAVTPTPPSPKRSARLSAKPKRDWSNKKRSEE